MPTSSRTPTSRMIDLVTGLRYHVLEWDAESDHTVVLVHGFLDLAWGWQPTVDAGLAGRFHIIAPDMRGHGDSDRAGPGAYYHFMDYLADLADLIDQLGRTRVSLVGHSMGGSICSYHAGTFADRIHKLVLMEGMGPPEMPVDMPTRARRWIAGWRKARKEKPRVYPTIEDAAARLRAHDPLLEPELASILAERGSVAVAGGRCFKHDPLHATMGPYPFLVDLAAEFWQAIKCPVLLVEGSESTFRHHPEEAERRYRHLARSRRTVLNGAGHMMQRHRPAELAELLATFLTE